MSGRRALGGAARCTTVFASRTLEQASRIRRRVDVPSRHQVAEQHLVGSGRRVWLISRIVDVVELSGLERFSILSITIVVTIIVKDEDSLTTQTSAQNYPFQESRWKRPVRTSLVSAIDFWLALKMTLEGKDEKKMFFFILREKEIRRLTSN